MINTSLPWHVVSQTQSGWRCSNVNPPSSSLSTKHFGLQKKKKKKNKMATNILPNLRLQNCSAQTSGWHNNVLSIMAQPLINNQPKSDTLTMQSLELLPVFLLYPHVSWWDFPLPVFVFFPTYFSVWICVSFVHHSCIFKGKLINSKWIFASHCPLVKYKRLLLSLCSCACSPLLLCPLCSRFVHPGFWFVFSFEFLFSFSLDFPAPASGCLPFFLDAWTLARSSSLNHNNL